MLYKPIQYPKSSTIYYLLSKYSVELSVRHDLKLMIHVVWFCYGLSFTNSSYIWTPVLDTRELDEEEPCGASGEAEQEEPVEEDVDCPSESPVLSSTDGDRETWLQLLSDFNETCTIHGIRYITRSTRYQLRR